MEEQYMIEINDVTMRFRMGDDNITSLKEYFVQLLRGKLSYSRFEALKHVSFNIPRGEVVGLIGRNEAHRGQRNRQGQRGAHAGIGQRL